MRVYGLKHYLLCLVLTCKFRPSKSLTEKYKLDKIFV